MLPSNFERSFHALLKNAGIAADFPQIAAMAAFEPQRFQGIRPVATAAAVNGVDITDDIAHCFSSLQFVAKKTIAFATILLPVPGFVKAYFACLEKKNMV